jgi:DNA-binding response OmpR family regulator
MLVVGMNADPTKRASESPVAKRTRKRILIVEDNYPVADSLKYALEFEDHEVVGIAATVEAAQELIGNKDCDVAILDVDLRGKSIVPVARRLAERAIPFIFVTGFGDSVALPPDLADAPRLDKPAALQEILALIEAIVKRNASV